MILDTSAIQTTRIPIYPSRIKFQKGTGLKEKGTINDPANQNEKARSHKGRRKWDRDRKREREREKEQGFWIFASNF